MGTSSVRSATFFFLMIALVSLTGIYLKSHKEKRPVIIHNKDWGHSVQRTDDGGYVIAGVSWRLGGWLGNAYLVKTDAGGSELWSKTFGNGDVSMGNSVKQTRDLGFIIAGNTWSSDGRQSDVYLVKTDIDGNRIWSRTYGGKGREEGSSVCQTTDGGFIVAGRTNSFGKGEDDVYLIKTDENGNENWSRAYGGSKRDKGSSVSQTADGGYIVAGRTDSFGEGEDDVYLIKTNADGVMVWSGTFGGKGRDQGNSVCLTDDGGYLVAGTTWSDSGKYSDVYLVKTDNNGKGLWHKTVGGKFGDYGLSVQQADDGGFIVAGNTWPFGRIGSSKVYLLRVDRDGNKVWARTMGAGGSEFGLSVCRAGDGGYVVAGKTVGIQKGDDDVYLVKVLGDGTEAWSRRIGRELPIRVPGPRSPRR
jgi:hypothetical protein